jgi:hypothetical protein
MKLPLALLLLAACGDHTVLYLHANAAETQELLAEGKPDGF